MQFAPSWNKVFPLKEAPKMERHISRLSLKKVYPFPLNSISICFEDWNSYYFSNSLTFQVLFKFSHQTQTSLISRFFPPDFDHSNPAYCISHAHLTSHEKMYFMACANRKDPDQLTQLHSLVPLPFSYVQSVNPGDELNKPMASIQILSLLYTI